MNTVKKFQRTKENFVCEVCGHHTEGDGYTNHCPECLSSKHVDIFPGDRLEDCGGIMDVIEVVRKGDGYVLVHRCRNCNYSHRDHFRDGRDNMDTLIRLSKTLANTEQN